MYKVVDGRYSHNFDTSPMPHYHAFPVILQFPRGIRQESGNSSYQFALFTIPLRQTDRTIMKFLPRDLS